MILQIMMPWLAKRHFGIASKKYGLHRSFLSALRAAEWKKALFNTSDTSGISPPELSNRKKNGWDSMGNCDRLLPELSAFRLKTLTNYLWEKVIWTCLVHKPRYAALICAIHPNSVTNPRIRSISADELRAIGPLAPLAITKFSTPLSYIIINSDAS